MLMDSFLYLSQFGCLYPYIVDKYNRWEEVILCSTTPSRDVNVYRFVVVGVKHKAVSV